MRRDRRASSSTPPSGLRSSRRPPRGAHRAPVQPPRASDRYSTGYTGWLEADRRAGSSMPRTRGVVPVPGLAIRFNLAAGFGTRRGVRQARRAGDPGSNPLMATGRIVLFGATGIHRPPHRRSDGRPRRPAGARRPQPGERSPSLRASSVGSTPRPPTCDRPKAVARAGRGRATCSSRPWAVHAMGRCRRRCRDRCRAPATWTPPASRLSCGASSSTTAPRARGRPPPADRLRMGVGPRQPRRRARAARGGSTRDARRRRLRS